MHLHLQERVWLVEWWTDAVSFDWCAKSFSKQNKHHISVNFGTVWFQFTRAVARGAVSAHCLPSFYCNVELSTFEFDAMMFLILS